MADNLIDVIKTCSIFKSLNEEGYQKLAAQLEKIHLQPNDVLFYQGDPSNYIYILVDGTLSTSLLTANNEHKHIGTLSPIELIGELGVLSGQPRSLTVKATHHSELLKIPDQLFKELCEQYPSILLEVIKPIISRSQQTIQFIVGQNKCKYVVLIPANYSVEINQFKNKLNEYVEKEEDIVLLEDSNINLTQSADYFSELEKKYHIIIIIVTHVEKIFSEQQVWLEKADMLYLLGNTGKEAQIDNSILEILRGKKYLSHARHELVLLHPDETRQPEHTSKWLEKSHFALTHHLRINNNKDYERLMRFITGKTTGLVLSGGGIKGWGHLGVIKAIEEKHILIDAIGGTSIGAVIGACYDMAQNYEDTFEMFYYLVKLASSSFSMRAFTWPLISISNAKSGTLALQKTFGNLRIEDLWTPFFCVSANLSERMEELHTSGRIWEKTRASASLPGLVPPMVLNGQLHFDGSLLNSLPIDHMKSLLGSKSKIIASDVSTGEKDTVKYDFPPIMGFMQGLLKQFKLGYKGYVVPPFFETFVSSMLLGSSHKEKKTMLLADYMINISVPTKISLLSLKRTNRKKLIDIGYEEARKVL